MAKQRDEHDPSKMPGKDPSQESAEARKTRLSKRSLPTQLSRKEPEEEIPTLPNLSLDEPEEPIQAEAVSEVLEAQPVTELGKPSSSVIHSNPADDDNVFNTDIVTAQPVSEAAPAGASEVLEAEALSEVQPSSGPRRPGEPPSEILDAEPVSALEQRRPLTGLHEVPGSARRPARPESDVHEAEPASGVVADPLSDVSIGDESSATRRKESVLSDDETGRAGRAPESPVHIGDDPSSAGRKSGSGRAERGSSIDWNEIEEASAVSGRDADKTSAFQPTMADDEGSAVNLGGSPHKAPDVEFDDLDEDEPVRRPRKSELVLGGDEDIEAAEAVSAASAAEAISGAEPVSAAEPISAVAPASSISDAEAVSGVSEAEPASSISDAEPAEEFEEEPKPRKKRAAVVDEEDEEFAGAGPGRSRARTAVVSAPAGPRPNLALRWLGGMLVGILLLGGAAVGVYYGKPDLFDLIPPSPNAVQKPAPPVVAAATPLQKASEKLAQKDYADAVNMLQDAKSDPELSVRSEARWLDYLQKAKDGKIDAAAPEVKQALEDAKAAKNDVLEKQIGDVLNAQKLQAQVTKLGAADKTLVQVRGLLEKAKLSTPGAKDEDLSKAITDALADKEHAEKLVAGIGAILAESKLIEDADKLDLNDVQKVVKDLSDKKQSFESVNKLLEKAEIKSAGTKGVQELVAAKKDVEGKLDEVNKVLADAKVKEGGAEGVKELLEARAKLEKDRDELDTAVKAGVAELADARIVPPGTDPRKQLVAGIKIARSKAESPLAMPLAQLGTTLGSIGTGVGDLVERTLDMSRTTAELAFYRAREPLIASPQQQLDAQIAQLLDRGHQDAKALAEVLRRSGWVLSDESKADPEARAKAQLAAGLALRNQQKYDEAREALQGALDLAKLVPTPGPWTKVAQQALKELTDPGAYYLPRVDRLQTEGNIKQALAEVKSGLAVMPNSGLLHAEKAQLELDQARQEGKIAPVLQKQIRAEAEAARKDPRSAAAGVFVLGQLEEQLGNLEGAEKLYREAIQTHQNQKGPADDGTRYRVALARLLQRDRPSAAVAPAAAPELAPEPAPLPAPKEEKSKEKVKVKEKVEEEKEEKSSRVDGVAHPLALLVLTASVGAQPGVEELENPQATARLNESIKIAQELIASPDPKTKGQGYVLLGQALSKQGKRTEGLREFVKGMNLLFPGLQSEDLNKLLAEHPAFQQPDAPKESNPLQAEKHYAEGLHFYWTRRYAEAENQFREAIAHFDQDARYQYYLGLAQLAQHTKVKRDAAYYSFEKGARLEAQSRPSINEINFSLERVQGDLRVLLNRFRYKTLAAAG